MCRAWAVQWMLMEDSAHAQAEGAEVRLSRRMGRCTLVVDAVIVRVQGSFASDHA